MSTQYLIIYKFTSLYHILEELSLDLNFKITFVSSQSSLNDQVKNLNNYLIVSDKENLNIRNQVTLNNVPMNIFKLVEKINEAGKLEWVYQEIAQLADKKRSQMPEEFAYMQIKNNWRLSKEQLTVLQALAAWRLATARKKDMALNFVFKEIHLYEAARLMPSSKSGLSQLHGVNPQSIRRYGETIITLISEARDKYAATSESQRLPKVSRLIDVASYKQTLASLKAVSDKIANENNVSPEVIASKKQLNQVLKWYWFDNDETRVLGLKPDVLSGWRAPLFEPHLEKLLGNKPSL